jgi:hypothetical protein
MHGRIGDKEDKEKQLIALDQLIQVESIFINMLENTAKENDILSLHYAGTIIYTWKALRPDQCVDYIKTKLQDCINVVKFLPSIESSFTSMDKDYPKSYKFKEDYYEKYISASNIVDSLNQARFKSQFWELPVDMQTIAATFIYLYENPKTDRIYMKSEYIDDLIQTWRKEYDDYHRKT